MNAVIEVPAMYGDHHVVAVRRALLGIDGVSEVQASAARRRVAVRFDEAVTSAEVIRESLVTAGYPPDQMVHMNEFPKPHEDGSAWFTVLGRKTVTERKDREMAGDFRRY